MSKRLPGQIYSVDLSEPSEEPLHSQTFILEHGVVTCVKEDDVIIGKDTKFTTELKSGQSLLIKNYIVKISTIIDDTTLILTTPWMNETLVDEYVYVFKFRPFAEFFGKYVYSITTPLGNSGLILEDFMVNFKRPLRELDEMAVPKWATDPESSADPTENGEDGISNSSKQPKVKPKPRSTVENRPELSV